MAKKRKGNLTPSELAILDALILRAIEKGQPVQGLLHMAQPFFWDDVTHAVNDALDRLSAAINAGHDAEQRNLDRAMSMNPRPMKAADEPELRELLLKRLAAGDAQKLDEGLDAEQLKVMRRELRLLALEKPKEKNRSTRKRSTRKR